MTSEQSTHHRSKINFIADRLPNLYTKSSASSVYSSPPAHHAKSLEIDSSGQPSFGSTFCLSPKPEHTVASQRDHSFDNDD
jgi:hypothetical protein